MWCIDSAVSKASPKILCWALIFISYIIIIIMHSCKLKVIDISSHRLTGVLLVRRVGAIQAVFLLRLRLTLKLSKL